MKTNPDLVLNGQQYYLIIKIIKSSIEMECGAAQKKFG